MTAGQIPAAFQPHPIVAPSQKVPYVDKDSGHLHPVGWQQASQTHDYVTGTSRRVACSCSSTSNTYTLTPNPGAQAIVGYFDYEEFAFVADAGSTGPVSATVVPNGPAASSTLPTLPVYKQNGAAQADNGDLTVGLQYNLTFADVLNGGVGGFVLR